METEVNAAPLVSLLYLITMEHLAVAEGSVS